MTRYFWVKAWHKDDKGLICDLPCSISFLEKQLITLSKLIFPNKILNEN